MARMRADLLLVSRGLVESRARAREAIEAGAVRAAGVVVRKPSAMVAEDVALEVAAPHPWVSRGGVKLAHALDVFGVRPTGRICLDIGASTGGFTQVLIERGAKRVYAVDVGHGQLHPSLGDDPRVISLERTDARELTAAQLPELPSLIVCDVSFIGAAKALARPLSLALADAELIVLVKPQFETGPRASRRGVLTDEAARVAARRAIDALDGLSAFRVAGETESPVRGGDGNLELLVHLKR